MERDDSWWQQQDLEQQEKEACEALDAVAKAGLTKEADLLASASGLASRWRKQAKRMEQRS